MTEHCGEGVKPPAGYRDYILNFTLGYTGGRRNTLAAFGLVLEDIERAAKYVTRLQGRSYKEIGGALF